MNVPECPSCHKPVLPQASAYLRQRGLACDCKFQPSELEAQFLSAWRAAGGVEPEREQKLIEGRRFRTDFCWREHRVVVEVDGAVHRTRERFHSDVAKSNLFQRDGWRVFRVTGRMIRDPEALGKFIAVVRGELGQ